MVQYRTNVLVCAGAGCLSCGCRPVKDALLAELERQGLQNEVRVVETGCVGRCDLGPVVLVYPEGVFYQRVKPGDIPEIVGEHLLKGRPVERLMPREHDEVVRELADLRFFQSQVRIALRNVGLIDPANIEEYIARDGYAALAKVLTEMTPGRVIEEVKRSGLRGRGGAGFPTGLKWQLTADVPSDVKYVLCNADEGDPGAFMDRSILEGDPHSILEAMAIAGYAVGARSGFVYVRAEYPLAVERLGLAIKQAREYGFLGAPLFGTDFQFNVDIRVGAGAFVCGEETAMINSIEGHRGEPRTKPPFPAVAGLWGKPTLNNNVETYANIPPIILNGADWFAQYGTEKSKGTKVFAIAGKIRNTGLVEVPMGTTLRTLVYDLGGGLAPGKEFKAAQVGGPSGGCLTKDHLDLPMDYESLREAGAMMGSGGLIIMDNETCMVDVARYFLDFVQDESCGRCTPCRIGTKKMLEIVERITEGEGTMADLAALEKLSGMIAKASLCGLGQSAPNPVLTTLRYFRDEYLAHINEKRCPAGVCKALLKYSIDPAACKGCGLCIKACPAGAITGTIRQAHRIDPELCARCGACESRCNFGAIRKE
ncbi:MAG: NADH-ubiquinone oxidoreductase-F iron-sulfur binding region domain-containing protein [Bacteroidota bacterium]